MVLRRRMPLLVPIIRLQKEQRSPETCGGLGGSFVTHARHIACFSGPLASSSVSEWQKEHFIELLLRVDRPPTSLRRQRSRRFSDCAAILAACCGETGTNCDNTSRCRHTANPSRTHCYSRRSHPPHSATLNHTNPRLYCTSNWVAEREGEGLWRPALVKRFELVVEVHELMASLPSRPPPADLGT